MSGLPRRARSTGAGDPQDRRLIGPATAAARRRGVVYAATDAGRGELHRWLTGPAPAPRTRDKALLMAFFLSSLEPQEAAAHLDGQAWRAARRGTELAELRRAVQADNSPLAQDGGLALEYGIRAARVQGEWAVWAAEQLTGTVRPEGRPARARTAKAVNTASPANAEGSQDVEHVKDVKDTERGRP